MKYLAVIALLGMAGIGWLNHERREAENRSFLNSDPWAWMRSEQGWAEPVLSPKDAKHPRIDQWGFDLWEPAGRYEVHIVPEHKELCIYHPENKENCHPIIH